MKHVKIGETSRYLGEGVVEGTRNSGPRDRSRCKPKGGGLPANTLMGVCHDEISCLEIINDEV
jgi:hypothetical protein